MSYFKQPIVCECGHKGFLGLCESGHMDFSQQETLARKALGLARHERP